MTLAEHLFDGWSGILAVAIGAPLLFAAVLVASRAGGRRHASRGAPTETWVAVAIGGLVALAVGLDEVSVAEGAVGIALMYALPWAFTRVLRRSSRLSAWLRPEPRLLFHQGVWCRKALSKEGLTKADVLAAVRQAGHLGLDTVFAVVIESDARISVVAVSAVEADEQARSDDAESRPRDDSAPSTGWIVPAPSRVGGLVRQPSPSHAKGAAQEPTEVTPRRPVGSLRSRTVASRTA